MRVMSYNVHHLGDDPAAVAEVLRDHAPDVVALQEPPRGPWGRWRLARLARAVGLEVAVAGGAARTTAILVRRGLAVTERRAVRLPRTGTWILRGVAMVEVQGVRVLSTHLGLRREERHRHVDHLLRLVAESRGPCVLAGDLNEQPGGSARARLVAHLRDAGLGPSFPSDAPRARIDVVLVTPEVEVQAAWVPDGPAAIRASDHRPVLADLRIGER